MIVLSDRVRVHFGDARDVLRTLPARSVDCVVTSPPYWQLRDYGHPEQLGMEETPDGFVRRLVSIFDDVRRVLTPDGVVWLNLGDTYTGGRNGGIGASSLTSQRNHIAARKAWLASPTRTHRSAPGIKQKELVGIPWRVALAMQSAGWFLRSEIVWCKPTAMPESVRDRPSRDHEHVFLLSRSKRYFYNADAIRTPLRPSTLTTHGRSIRGSRGEDDDRVRSHGWAKRAPKRIAKVDEDGNLIGANARTVWRTAIEEEIARLQRALEVGSESVWPIVQDRWEGEHTSTFPVALARRCILAGCPIGGTVLDPFCGTGTTLAAALEVGRESIGIDISEGVLPEIEQRLAGVQLALPEVAAR